MPNPYVVQGDIEGEIVRISDRLEKATDRLQEVSVAHAHAEADYRYAYAQAFLKRREGDEKLTDKIREQRATEETTEQFRARRVAEAEQMSLQEKCRQLRSQLDAIRTLSANVRAQT